MSTHLSLNFWFELLSNFIARADVGYCLLLRLLEEGLCLWADGVVAVASAVGRSASDSTHMHQAI